MGVRPTVNSSSSPAAASGAVEPAGLWRCEQVSPDSLSAALVPANDTCHASFGSSVELFALRSRRKLFTRPCWFFGLGSIPQVYINEVGSSSSLIDQLPKLPESCPARIWQNTGISVKMAGLYYTQTSSRSSSSNSSPQNHSSIIGDAFFSRFTSVNVNHVSFNNFTASASDVAASSNSYCGYSTNQCNVAQLPPYHNVTSMLDSPTASQSQMRPQNRQDLQFSLPSSCESPMSLPTFSPPMNSNYLATGHPHPSTYQDDAHTHTSNQVEDFTLDEHFSLDLMAAQSNNSSADGKRFWNLETGTIFF